MDKLNNMPNVGKVLEKNLMDVGITTPAKLVEIGAKQAFMLIRATVDPDACLHMLYGLEGAVEGIKDNHLSTETKEDLKSFFKTL